jgi:indolepyruvate ferredoxin oxidoreductase beta subunit
LIGEFKIPPLSVSSGDDDYPDDAEIERLVAQVTQDFYFVPTLTLASKLGNARAHNVVLLGALSAFLEDVPLDVWLDVIADRVPARYVDLNREAFLAGRQSDFSESQVKEGEPALASLGP